MTKVGKPSTMVHWCGQEIELQEVHNGWLIWPIFRVDGERVKVCPQCGGMLRVDRLRFLAALEMTEMSVEMTG